MTLTDHIALVHARAAALSARVAIVGLEATRQRAGDLFPQAQFRLVNARDEQKADERREEKIAVGDEDRQCLAARLRSR